MGSIHSSMTMYLLELQTVLHHSYIPEYGYYLQINPHMGWTEFTEMMGEPVAEWVKCTQCRRTWEVVSTLSDTKGQPVIFRDSLNVYPEYAHAAITKFKDSFRSTQFTDKICFYPHAKSFNDGMNFGRETTDGHVHLYLESNLPELDDTQKDITVARQRMVKLALPQFESMSVDWTAASFKKAAQANYGCYNEVIKDFCLRMSNNMDIVKSSPRMLRPLLIQEINLFCASCDSEDDIRQIVKIFRRRSRIEYTPRELIFRNFILPKHSDADVYEWPVKSSYGERIAAIGLRNWLHKQTDEEVSCLIMGISPSSPRSMDDDQEYLNYALGKALRLYLEGGAIGLGTNQHRLQVLFYYLTNIKKSMPGLSTVESCSLLFMDEGEGVIDGVSDSAVLAGFLDAPMGVTKAETLFNALVAFTNCPAVSKNDIEDLD